MIKVRNTTGTDVFYESTTGQTLSKINSVSFEGVDNTVVTVVYKDSVAYVYLPQKDLKLFKLSDVVDKMGYAVNKVS